MNDTVETVSEDFRFKLKESNRLARLGYFK